MAATRSTVQWSESSISTFFGSESIFAEDALAAKILLLASAVAGVTSLPRHQDPKQALARQMGVMGLPITVLLDAQGNEIARLIGDADWTSDSARAILRELVSGAAG